MTHWFFGAWQFTKDCKDRASSVTADVVKALTEFSGGAVRELTQPSHYKRLPQEVTFLPRPEGISHVRVRTCLQVLEVARRPVWLELSVPSGVGATHRAGILRIQSNSP